MPRWYAPIFHIPMSSPMMKTMFGRCCCCCCCAEPGSLTPNATNNDASVLAHSFKTNFIISSTRGFEGGVPTPCNQLSENFLQRAHRCHFLVRTSQHSRNPKLLE